MLWKFENEPWKWKVLESDTENMCEPRATNFCCLSEFHNTSGNQSAALRELFSFSFITLPDFMVFFS